MTESRSLKVTAQAGRKGVWTVSLDAEALTFAAGDGDESFQILRADADEKTELRESWFTDPLLLVSISKKKVIFKLRRAQVAALKEWLGPPTIRGLKVALKRRLAWNIPIGIFFVLVSLPLAADPEAGTEAVPFDAVSAALGASLIAIAILARLWTRRILLLLDALWYLFLAIDIGVGIFHGKSPMWALLIIVLLMGAKSGFSEHQRFAHLSKKKQDDILRADDEGT
jgi:hypothetical protein